jgi:hypothetical protein
MPLFRAAAVLLLAIAAATPALAADAVPPDGSAIPPVANTEDPSGAFGQGVKAPPPPKPWDQESIWNMKVEGFTDNQGRPIYQPLVVNQDGRHILYLGNLGGNLENPLTGQVEANGTSIVDVSDVAHSKFLFHIPGPSGPVAAAGAQMVRVCSGSVLPHGEKGKWYLLRAYGNVGTDEAQQIWDVTNPAGPSLLTTVVSGLSNTDKNWWECDTGIAYLVAGSASDGWHQSASKQHIKIYDLSDPKKPVYVRDFGLVGQQPGARHRAKLRQRAGAELLRGHHEPAARCARGDLDGGRRQPGLSALRCRRQRGDPDRRPAEALDRLHPARRLGQLRDKPDRGRAALSADQLYSDEPREWRPQCDADPRRPDARATGELRRRHAAKEESADRQLGRGQQQLPRRAAA